MLQRAEEQSRFTPGRVNAGEGTRWKQERDLKLQALHAQGRTDAQIADLLGMSHGGITYARERLGLPKNPTQQRRRRKP